MTSIGTLTAIAIERYIIISRSLHGQTLTHTASFFIIFLIWMYSLIQAVPPLLGWNRYIVEHPGIACSLDWQTPDYYHSTFIAYIFIIGYILPVLIMSYCYIKVICILRKVSLISNTFSLTYFIISKKILHWKFFEQTLVSFSFLMHCDHHLLNRPESLFKVESGPL